MRTSVKIVTTALAVAAMFGLSGPQAAAESPAGATVSAPAADVSATVISNHYQVTNLMSHDNLKLTRITGQKGDDELMPIGTVLKPGQRHPFGVTYHFLDTDPYRNAYFDVIDPATGTKKGTVVASARYASSLDQPQTVVAVRDNAPVSATSDRNGFYITDRTPTTIDVPAGRAQEQSDVLRSFCADNRLARCTFTPTGYQRNVLSDARDVVTYANYGQNPAWMEHTKGIALVESNSINLSVTASTKLSVLAHEINLEFTAEYGHTWQQEESVSTAVGQTVPVGYVGLITEQHPVDRVIGDFTVVLGNTTWKLHGIAFDSPLPPTGTSTHFAYYEWKVGTARPSPEELATLPPIVPAAR